MDPYQYAWTDPKISRHESCRSCFFWLIRWTKRLLKKRPALLPHWRRRHGRHISRRGKRKSLLFSTSLVICRRPKEETDTQHILAAPHTLSTWHLDIDSGGPIPDPPRAPLQRAGYLRIGPTISCKTLLADTHASPANVTTLCLHRNERQRQWMHFSFASAIEHRNVCVMSNQTETSRDMICTLISSSQRIQSAPSSSRIARPNFKTSRETNWGQTICVLENISNVFAVLAHVETSRSKSVAKIGLHAAYALINT